MSADVEQHRSRRSANPHFSPHYLYGGQPFEQHREKERKHATVHAEPAQRTASIAPLEPYRKLRWADLRLLADIYHVPCHS